MTIIGSNTFRDVLVPLAFEDRYFILEQENPPVISVLHQTAAGPQWEIWYNEPGETSVTLVRKSPPGIVTVTDRETGKFIYKLRPGSETSIIFGTLQGGETECVIRDGQISTSGVTMIANDMERCAVGIRINSNGGGVLGGPALPAAVLRALETRVRRLDATAAAPEVGSRAAVTPDGGLPEAVKPSGR